jgi:hypothetical protein
MFDLGPQQFPSLKAKGAETRHLVEPLLAVMEKLADQDVREERLMKMLLKHAARLERILDENASEYKLSIHAAQEFQESTEAIVQINTSLGHAFHQRGILLFHTVIKFHYVLHIGLISHFINPRLGWCYAGEDFMHRIKTIAQASQSGTPPSLAVAKMMRKYSQGLALFFVAVPLR